MYFRHKILKYCSAGFCFLFFKFLLETVIDLNSLSSIQLLSHRTFEKTNIMEFTGLRGRFFLPFHAFAIIIANTSVRASVVIFNFPPPTTFLPVYLSAAVLSGNNSAS